jgi:hypothetical protein
MPTQVGFIMLVSQYNENHKSLKHLKNLKTGLVAYLGLELTVYVIKSQIHLASQSL